LKVFFAISQKYGIWDNNPLPSFLEAMSLSYKERAKEALLAALTIVIFNTPGNTGIKSLPTFDL
jgi:hypothetical protein